MNNTSSLSDQELSLIQDFNIGKHQKTKKDYIRELNAFRKFIDKDLINALAQDGINYIAFLRKNGKASSTIRRIYDQLNVFYNYLFREGHIKSNPFYRIEKPKASKQVKAERTPTPEDLEKLLDTLNESFNPRDLAAIILILTTGLRVGQALSVKWNDFVHAEDHIALRTNNTPPKYVKIFDFVWQLIDKYRRDMCIPDIYIKKNYYVFIGQKQLEKYLIEPSKVTPITSDWIRKVLEKACSMADITLYTSKDLRHAFAIYALNLNASTKEVADQMDWSNENQANKYVGVIEQLISPAGTYTEDFFRSIFLK